MPPSSNPSTICTVLESGSNAIIPNSNMYVAVLYNRLNASFLLDLQAHRLCGSSLLRFLRPIFRPTRSSIANPAQIHSPPNQMIPHPRTILTPPASHKHHTMLLHIMSLARYISRNHPARAQSDTRGLAFGGIGLLRLRDAYFQTDAFELRGIDVAEGWGNGFSRSLLRSTAFCDLVVGCGWRWCSGEIALEGRR